MPREFVEVGVVRRRGWVGECGTSQFTEAYHVSKLPYRRVEEGGDMIQKESVDGVWVVGKGFWVSVGKGLLD
jgi:hypothetical protein